MPSDVLSQPSEEEIEMHLDKGTDSKIQLKYTLSSHLVHIVQHLTFFSLRKAKPRLKKLEICHMP